MSIVTIKKNDINCNGEFVITLRERERERAKESERDKREMKMYHCNDHVYQLINTYDHAICHFSFFFR